MSYDVAIWAGPRPADDDQAAEEFERRAEALESEEAPEPASPALVGFLDELLAVLPPLDDSDDPRSPWATGPEPGDVSGDFAYLTMTYPGAETSLDTVAEVARRRGLVCFDPQDGALL